MKSLLILALAMAPSLDARAQSVGSSCVGSRNPDGTINYGDCGSAPPPAPAGSSSGFTPVQQLQLQGAQAAGAAMGTALVNWLLSGPSGPTPQQQEQARLAQEQRRIEAMRRQLEEERLQRERERAQRQKERDELLSNIKSVGSDAELRLKEPEEASRFSPLEKQKGTIDCAMAELYNSAIALGPSGREYARGLLETVRRAESGLSAAPPDPKSDAYDVVAITHAKMTADQSGESQMISDIGVSRNLKTGELVIHTQYSIGTLGRGVERQNLVILDAAGNVECQQLTPETAQCASQLNPAAASGDYCPKPPPAPETPAGRRSRWWNWGRKIRHHAATPAPPARRESGPRADGLELK